MWSSLGTDLHWDLIVSSPMQRCQAFAQAVAENQAIELRIEDDLKEIGFGSWEGKTRDQLIAQDEQGFNNFYVNPVKFKPEGAESLEALTDRVGQVMDDLVRNESGKSILVVAHGAVIRATIGYILEIPLQNLFQIKIDYATRIRFELRNRVQLVMG